MALPGHGPRIPPGTRASLLVRRGGHDHPQHDEQPVGNYWSGYPAAGRHRARRPACATSARCPAGGNDPSAQGESGCRCRLPSVEIGLGASNLLQSSIYALNGLLKFAIHEGYHDIPVPSFRRPRLGVAPGRRAAGRPTIITVEGVISKAFGVGGTFTLEPYVGAGAVLDRPQPGHRYRADRGPLPRPGQQHRLSTQQALAQKIVFPTQDNIIRWRASLGGINCTSRSSRSPATSATSGSGR